jgi:hypothetical protein
VIDMADDDDADQRTRNGGGVEAGRNTGVHVVLPQR